MKHLLIIAVFSLLSFQQAISQTPVYMLFNSGCMEQQEFKNSLNGSIYSAFAIHAGNEQYLLRTGEATLTTTTLPKEAVTCGNLTLGEELLRDVNNALRPVYILVPAGTGYSMLPVTVATQFKRSGSYIFVKSAKYSFAVDTSNLVPNQNLASAGSETKVYYVSKTAALCKEKFTYRLEPREAEYKADLDYIPGIGITEMRFGAAGPKQEIQSLERVNGMTMSNHLAKSCNIKIAEPEPAKTVVVEPVKPAETKTPAVAKTPEPYQQTVKPVSNPYAIDPMYKPLAECPEKPGYGFHIVQPGESLNAIARTYGVSTKQLTGWNKIKDADHIEPCQKIWLIEPPKPAEPVKTSQTTPKAPQIDPGLRVVSQAPLWDLQPGQVGPPSPSTYALAAKSPAENAAASPRYHTVQKGETVSSLSKKYGFTEAAFRKLNNLPAKGDVVIFPGQKLLIDDPSKPPQATTPPPAETPATRKVAPTAPGATTQTATPKSVEPTRQPTAPVLTQPAEQPKPPAPVVQPAETVAAKPQVTAPPPVQEVFSEEAIVAPVTTTAKPSTPVVAKPVETVREPAYIQEYTVREGDSIDSVAKKFGITSKDLAEFNAKKSDDKLVAGTRLMIPKY